MLLLGRLLPLVALERAQLPPIIPAEVPSCSSGATLWDTLVHNRHHYLMRRPLKRDAHQIQCFKGCSTGRGSNGGFPDLDSSFLFSEVNKRGRPSKWPPECLPSNFADFECAFSL